MLSLAVPAAVESWISSAMFVLFIGWYFSVADSCRVLMVRVVVCLKYRVGYKGRYIRR